MTNKRAPRRTQRERVEESSRRLLESALELIARQGLHRTTLAEISENAGYSRPMANIRYGSKEALLATILRTEYEDRINPVEETAHTGLDRVLDRIDRLTGMATTDETVLRAIIVLCFEAVGSATELRPYVQNWLDRLAEGIANALRAGQDDGSVRGEVSPDDAAHDIVAEGIGACYMWVLRPDQTVLENLTAPWRARVQQMYGNSSHTVTSSQ